MIDSSRPLSLLNPSTHSRVVCGTVTGLRAVNQEIDAFSNRRTGVRMFPDVAVMQFPFTTCR